ncbi:MAG TPA: DUF1800 domain-containing protein [Bryobacteraceae bacterium]|nr:DUF1800 domain-containing protein [Bryobacteraceae bacterium]
MRKPALGALFAVLAVLSAASVYAKKTAATNVRPAKQWTTEIPKDKRIDQALNRLTFGPRPGDAAGVQAMGLNRWIERQLHPGSIPENPLLAEKLKTLDTLALSSNELVRDYPTPQMVRQMVNGQVPFPNNPERRRMIQKLVAKYEERLKAGQDANANPNLPDTKTLGDLLSRDEMRSLRTGTPNQRMAALEALPQDRQDDVIAAMGGGMRQAIFPVASPELRRKLEMANGPAQVVARDLTEAKILRAVYSSHQLEEVLDDFWFNHFNVFLDKGADRYLVTAYERESIRPHVLGKFHDLLEATAKSPAMLFYLDNWQSVGPNAPGAGRGNAKQARRGLNENYGRELMELHTLGVNGGYTQKDVTEVARCFTGWTINQPQRGGQFTFNPRLHDNGEKVVLGVTIPAGGGQSDGEKVLDILVHHPSTAHFISRKLAQRFVTDDPPESLVARMAETFQRSNGDIAAVLETMLKSKEFWSEGAYRSKMKSPLEMVASAVRAVGGDVDFAFPLVNQVAQLGEPLYRKIEPTGYANSSKEWMNSAGLMARMNFALQLADNKIPGVKVEKTVDQEGIQLGSPEFQKR